MNSKQLDRARGALRQAIQISGGQTKLARAMSKMAGYKITQQNVNSWIKAKNSVPKEYVFLVEGACHNFITRFDLRPDIFRKLKKDIKL